MSDKINKYLNRIEKITNIIVAQIDTINADTTEAEENFVEVILSSGLREIEKIIEDAPFGTFCSYSDYSNIKDGLYKRLRDRPTRNWVLQWHKDFKDTIRILKDGQISEKDKVTFLQKIKRFSKLLYRVVKTLMDFNYTYYFFEELIRYSTYSASLVLVSPLGVAIAAISVFKPFIFSRLVKGLLNIIEGSLRRDNSNIKEFDQLAFGKQASLYPHTARFARQLEQYCNLAILSLHL